jgi:hypothetical protein
MNPEETFRKFLEGHQGEQLGFRIGAETIRAKVFAVRADYVELKATFGSYESQQTKDLKVPLRAITWVE